MTKSALVNIKLPDAPGVYFFIGPKREIMYIGRATSLKHRVRSYFDPQLKEKRSPLIEKMVAEAKNVEYTETDSVLEAMLLEANLIRSHKPRFNTISKDDKSYNHLVITNEPFPRVLVVRGKDVTERFTPEELKHIFGPFPSGSLLKEALKIVRRLFQFYDTNIKVGSEKSKMAKGKIDFNRQIGLYPNSVSKAAYAQTIRHIALFFSGKKERLISELERDMHRAARQEKFERAHEIKHRIHALKHIQDVALIKDEHRIHRDDRAMRIEAYDVAHLGGNDMVGVMTVVEALEAQPHEYRKFKIKSVSTSHDTAALREIVDRRLSHDEWPLPQLIVVDGSVAQKRAAESVLAQYGYVIPVVGVVKDEHHRPVRIIGPQKVISEHHDAILFANAESHRFAITYHRSKRAHRYR